MANDGLELTRREAGAIIAAGGAALLAGQVARGQEPPPQPARPLALAGNHQVVPLGFDPKGLRGLSERLLVSHHENNYAGAVRNLNRVEQDLAAVTKDTPGFQVFGLQERALLFRNSKTLHELYFATLGGDGKAGGAAQELLAAQLGSFGRFEELFRATAMSLAGGSGWAVLAVQLADASPVIYAAADHTRNLPQGVPLLVLDMYEHAYHLDFGAAAARYVDAFFQNVRWDEVNRRLARAQAASAALRGA
jgi:superoxide dismutase, Fe-Mn family